MIRSSGFLFCLGLLLLSCGNQDVPNPFDPGAPQPGTPPVRNASIGIIGSVADVQTQTSPGLVIMGGGADVDAAFRWMISRSGGGDVVIIRATGTDAYNAYVDRLGTVNSVETLKIDSRDLANDDGVAQIIRNAEMLFIAGGDQSDYTRYWKDTKVMDAINYLLNEKKVPVGGTSAGAAILGRYYFSGENGSVTSEEALSNPYGSRMTLGQDDFLKAPYLHNVITDQHFSQRDRQGRSMAFLGRIMKDWNIAATAIAVDERTAVCIDQDGQAEVLGSNKAYFLKTAEQKSPEIFTPNTPVTWSHDGKAIKVSVLSASSGSKFDMVSFEIVDSMRGEKYWWSVHSGNWSQIARLD